MNGAATLTALSLGSAALAGGVPATLAPAPECNTSVTDYCVEDQISIPGEAPEAPTAPTTPQPVRLGPSPTPEEPDCSWLIDPGTLHDGAPGAFPIDGVRPADDAYLIFERCDGELTGRVRWTTPADPAPLDPPAATPAPAPALPSPQQLADTIRARLEGDLPQPVAATSPPAGEPAVVNHPTFLAIDNWTGAITDQECERPLCVTVTATPALAWTPGEPGSATLACAGGGTTYNPNGGSPQDQAAQPGACAHAYQARTGAGGRPDAWPGVASVTWLLTWASTTGAGGPLAPIVRSTPVPRAVDEVQAVVVH